VTEISRVVVGVDGSDASRTALRWALAEARLRRARLEVLHAWRTPMLFVPDAYDAALVEMGAMEEAALRFIDRELDAIGVEHDGRVVIEPSTVEQSPAHALVDASKRAQLVVLGRHGSSGFRRDLISPKAVQVAHHASCSVAVVPDAWPGDGNGVVVGVDGSTHSTDALRWAAGEAKARQSSLNAVMAWGLLDQHRVDPEESFDPTYGAQQAQEALDAYVKRTLDVEPANVTRTVVNDLPAAALLEASANAELLVVGARGLGGFKGLLLGSVSHRCLTHAMIPTVVVRS